MSATDTYTKYNLHLAASYIGRMSGYAKKQGGIRPCMTDTALYKKIRRLSSENQT